MTQRENSPWKYIGKGPHKRTDGVVTYLKCYRRACATCGDDFESFISTHCPFDPPMENCPKHITPEEVALYESGWGLEGWGKKKIKPEPKTRRGPRRWNRNRCIETTHV